jgi:YD repeat-containing protein
VDGRLVKLREYTGRATAGTPTTLTTNRPTGKLRASDPDFFETRWEYNTNSLVTRRIDPELDETLLEYQIVPGGLPVYNPVKRTELAGPRGGDQISHVTDFTYEANHNSLSQVVDPRGGVTTHVHDANGNRTHTTHAVASIVEDFEYNAFGQMSAHILPADATSFRRRDEFHYYPSGLQKGYLHERVVDAGVGPAFLKLTTTYEYDSLGHVVRTIDARGNDTLFDVNALGQVVRERSPSRAVRSM